MRSHVLPRRGVKLAVALAPLVSLLGGCHPKPASQHHRGPTPVQVEHLRETTVTDYDEYLASLTSRRSILLYPQVTGHVLKIRVKPGDRVKEGEILVEIDPGQQRAMLKSLEATLQTKKANLAYAIQNDESSRKLVKAGLLGDLDYQQRHSQRLSAVADVKAAEAQIQAQSDLLRFYTITAPSDGVVGDVPVKIGDYVDPQTRLTSVDQNKLVEAYVYVPITKANRIKRDTDIELVDDSGKVVCEQKPSFISPEVSVDTQTVLVKTICPNDGALRAAQVLQARVIWSRHPGITLPTTDAVRESGEYFAYLVAHGPNGPIARQQLIQVGAIQGNAFVVTEGLKAGDEIITSNIQKIHDGAPIAPIDGDASAATAQKGG